MRNRLSGAAQVHAALFAVALLFSANYIISKIAMRSIDPFAFAWIRIAGSALLMNAFLVRRGASDRRPPEVPRRQLVMLAFLGVVFNQLLFLGGLALTEAHAAAILITTIPVFALGAAIVRGSERPNAARVGGIALAAAGALLIVGGHGFASNPQSTLGAVMIVVNCLSYALYLVLSKPVLEHLPARSFVRRLFTIGTLLMLPFAAPALLRQSWREVPLSAWVALAIVIVGPTVGAYLLNVWALARAESSLVATYTYVQPVLATILAAMFLGEHLRPVIIVAAITIFAGVWLAGRSSGPIPE